MQIKISEIQEKETKSQRIVPLNRFLVILIIGCMILVILDQFNSYDVYLFGTIILIFLLMIILDTFHPRLSTYENMRYNLNELVVSLNSKDSKNAITHLNRLAFDLHILDEELEDIFILRDAKQIIHDFWFVLKYEVYPDLLNKERMSVLKTHLEQIDNAISDEDIDHLNNIVSALKKEDLIDETVILPYEKPSITNQIFMKSKSFVFINFKKNVFFRFSILIIIFIILVSLFYSVDKNTILGIGVISAALAAAYKQTI